MKPGFEGGQLPLAQRIPKLKGFHNPFRVAYAVVNLDTLENFAGDVATPTTLEAVGLVRKGALVKVLGRGDYTAPCGWRCTRCRPAPVVPSKQPEARWSCFPFPSATAGPLRGETPSPTGSLYTLGFGARRRKRD